MLTENHFVVSVRQQAVKAVKDANRRRFGRNRTFGGLLQSAFAGWPMRRTAFGVFWGKGEKDANLRPRSSARR